MTRVLTSQFLTFLNHCAVDRRKERMKTSGKRRRRTMQGGAGENLFSTFSILETRLSGAPAAAGTHSDGQSPSLAVVGPSPGLLIGQRECFRQRADFELAKFRRNFGEILPKIWQRQKFAELLPKFPRKFAKILAQSFCRSFAENLAKSLPNFCRSLGES